MDLLVHLLNGISVNSGGDEASEMLLVHLLIILLHLAHVVSHVDSHDAILVGLGIEILGITRVSGESLLVVGNVKTTIGSTLHGTEHASTSGGVLGSDIQQGTEGSAVIIELLNVVLAAINLGDDLLASHLLNTFVGLIKSNLLKKTTGKEKSGAVSSGVVLKSNGKVVLGELLGVGRAKNLVTDNLGVHNLAENVLVGDTDNKSVLGGLVLVLVLGDELMSLTVVSLSLTTSSVLDLEGLEVLLVLNNLNEWHFEYTPTN
mmetsp:Transcript_121430/g.181404  ORF Transcript_121430/g.181404 Transcript_121430/m.181404 type:complete len:261 (+) Transcript_121430:241-1023(+)